jgi:Xaa-Pro aminopeptidase
MQRARLIYAAPERDADLLYITRFFAPDSFLWWEWRGRTHAIFNPLEIDRARQSARIDRIFGPDDFFPVGTRDRSVAALIACIAKAQKFRAIEVPEDFPLGIATALKKHGLKLTTAQAMFFPQRQHKTLEEVVHLRKALRMAEAGLERGLEVLRQSKIGRRNVLQWSGGVLTSERLRGEIDATVIRLGGLPAGTIVAGGKQGCDPHERGHGPLRAHESIILDIFPRDQRTGYYGDLTRTVVKGRASLSLQELYATVAQGKKWVISQMKSGVDGKKLHNQLVERFTMAGYPTEQRNGRWVGFFHGTGHGLGLDLHEFPRFSAGKLFSGLSITVEPGLYYPDIGGVRLEDVVVVNRSGVTNLTYASQTLAI